MATLFFSRDGKDPNRAKSMGEISMDSPGTQVTRVKDLSRSLKGGLP